MKVEREENESLLEYYDRLIKNRKELDLDYVELEEIILGETPYCSENVRKGIYFLEKALDKLLEEERAKNFIPNESIKTVEELQELEEEKKRVQKELSSMNKEIAKLEGKEERRLTIVEKGEYYTIYSGKREITVKRSTVSKIKELYCGAKYTTLEVCRELELSRDDFMLIKSAFGIIKADVPYLDDEITEDNLDYLVGDTLERNKRNFFLKLDKENIKAMEKELAGYRAYDNFYSNLIKDTSNVQVDNLVTYPKIEINSDRKVEAMLDTCDFHVGQVSNNFFNVYNSEVARDRVDQLVKEVVEAGQMYNISVLHLNLLGDSICGVIHGSLMKTCEFDITEQVKVAKELYVRLIMGLSSAFDKVVVSGVVGNHGRIHANKDNNIEKENFEYIIMEWLKDIIRALPNINNVVFIANEIDEGIIYKEICGVKMICEHGHLSSLNGKVEALSTAYGRVDEIHQAHLHHNETKEVNNCEVFVSRSFCGTDAYAKDLRKVSKAGQRLFIYSEEKRIAIKEITFN